ncbi:MAG: hypothetical protein CVV51_11320 [Spirochaetae bacterium HGW-Spirochaetae-7]|jgi:hypothetical protein|nr:MAG: hypothetical protein CVV51_11320 [Spirochaetae bacterium HGW-Spirochaetae-7]
MAALLAISCATAPPPVVVDTAPKPETEMAKATERRAYVKDNGLEAYAPDSFKKAEDNYTAAGKVYGTDNAKAKELLDLALPLYEQTVTDGFTKKVAEKKAVADSSKSKADEQKAKVAAKDSYAAAEAAYAKAVADAAAGQYASSVASYQEAAKKYEEAASIAAAARTQAQTALDSANASIQSTADRLKAIDTEMAAGQGGTP